MEDGIDVKYNEGPMKLFWEMMAERHNIYKKRTSGSPPPWTEDVILSEFKFTNVFRELDTGTRFVTDYLMKRCRTLRTYTMYVMLYRLFNKIESVHSVLEEFSELTLNLDVQRLEYYFRKYAEENPEENVFTNAFIVSGYSHLPKEWDKISRVCFLIGELQKSIKSFRTPDTMEQAYKWVVSQNGFGPFLAYQVVVDMSYHPAIPFGEDDFVICGPGCKRGLDRLFPPHIIKAVGYEELNFWLRDMQYEFYEDYKINYKELLNDREYPYLTVMSVENLLCEFSKYMKVVNGEGRPRNRHNPKASYNRISSNLYSAWFNKDKPPVNVYIKLDMQDIEGAIK